MIRSIIDVIVKIRNRHLFFADVAMLLCIPSLAMLLRLETVAAILPFTHSLVWFTVFTVAAKVGVFLWVRLYSRFWRYASVEELEVLLIATVGAGIVTIGTFFSILMPLGAIAPGFPRSVPIIDAILTMIFVAGIRLGIRLLYAMDGAGARNPETTKRVLVAGAGEAGSMVVKELRSNTRLGLQPVCFLDDDPRKARALIHGVEVKGNLGEIKKIAEREKIDEVVIALPSASGKVVQQIVQNCREIGLSSKTVPGLSELLLGSSIVRLRDVNIDDLLRRGIIRTNNASARKVFSGLTILVTGAGGSIGSELVRQIAGFIPKAIILLGHGENSLFSIASELRAERSSNGSGPAVVSVVADIRDKSRMDQIFRHYRPDAVFHAAAHKHVGLMEVNIPDAITNNIEGTRCLVSLAEKYGVKQFVMISSDKAVNPTSVMGATKRVAELVVQDAARRSGLGFVVVRFGNVLGSRGSVVPIFQKQIAEGGPVKVTHPDATRFFMTIPEAVHLVLQAGAMGKGGDMFVLDMGEPIRILNLARDLIRLSRYEEGTDIDIEFTGLRTGEKLHEEILYDHESLEPSGHEKIFRCRSRSFAGHAGRNGVDLHKDVARLTQAACTGNTGQMIGILAALVPQYGMALSASGGNGSQASSGGINSSAILPTSSSIDEKHSS